MTEADYAVDGLFAGQFMKESGWFGSREKTFGLFDLCF